MSFTHTSTAEVWEEYRYDTTDGPCKIAVRYLDGKLDGLYIKGIATETIKLETGDAINSFLTCLHAAVAGIHKRGSDHANP